MPAAFHQLELRTKKTARADEAGVAFGLRFPRSRRPSDQREHCRKSETPAATGVRQGDREMPRYLRRSPFSIARIVVLMVKIVLVIFLLTYC